MKQAKVFLLALTVLITALLVSCAPGQGQAAVGWSGTAFHDGIVYAGTRDGRVVAVNAMTGELIWSHPFEVEAGGGLGCGPSRVADAIYTTPVVDGDLVYIGTFSGKVVALNTTARAQELRFPQGRHSEWEWECPGEDAASNSIVGNLLVTDDAVYASSSNGRVYSLDKRSGDENWTRDDTPDLGQKLWTSPVISGGVLYVSTFDGHIYALSVETGERLDWKVELQGGLASSPVVHDGIIYAGSFDNNLYAIKVGDSEPRWTFSGRRWFWAAPVVDNGVVYAGSLDGTLYALDADTGELLWPFDAGGPIVAPPLLADRLLFVIGERGDLYVLDLEAVQEEGEMRLIREGIRDERGNEVKVVSSLSVNSEAGMVYYRGEDNRVYAIDIDSGSINWVWHPDDQSG